MYPFLPSAKSVLVDALAEPDIDDAVAYLKQEIPESLFGNPGRHVKMYALSKALLSCCSDSVKRKYAALKAEEYVKHANQEQEQAVLAKAFFPSFSKGGLVSSEADVGAPDAGGMEGRGASVGGPGGGVYGGGDEGSGTEGNLTLSLNDYLIYGQHLAQQSVKGGVVSVSAQELNDLLKKAVEQKFLETKAQEVPEIIRGRARQLDTVLPAPKSGAKFLELGCMRAVRAGAPEGKRFYGAMGLAIASQRDGVEKAQALALMDDYVSKCSGTKPFAPREGQSVVEWVFGRQIGFSCKTMMDNGFEADYCGRCPLNWKRRKR